MGGWSKQTIGDLVAAKEVILQTGPFGSQLHAYDYIPTGIAVIPTEAIQYGKIDHAVLPKISVKKAEELGRHRVFEGDIIFARRGAQATGRTAKISRDESGFICGTGVIRLRVSSHSNLDTNFLAHLLSAPNSIKWFKFRAIGATMPNLNEGIIRSFLVDAPPRAEQRAIAELLSALDDKIELNRRMNETLEASARALFRDWFVDFGPTRAKVEGRPAYLAPDLWSLFPDRLDDDGKPKRWSGYTLGDLAHQHTASVDPAKTGDELFEHYSLPAFDNGASPSIVRGDAIKSNKTLIPAGSVLLSKLNPEISRVWMPNPAKSARQVASTEFLAFVPKALVSRSLLLAIFCDVTFRQIMEGMVTGTSKSHQRISPPALRAVTVLTGAPAIFDAFERIASPIMDRILMNRLESQTLAATRDALLPKLMSGELRVRDAEALAA